MPEAGLSLAQKAQLEAIGAVLTSIPDDLTPIAALFEDARPGQRLFALQKSLKALLSKDGSLGKLAQSALGLEARPVRVLLFDKSAQANWSVPWHQDRTVAVKQRHDVEGYAVWSKKDGAVHVEPPFSIMERMITFRLHLDETNAENAPLLTADSSHTFGKIDADRAYEVAQTCRQSQHTASPGDVLILRTSILHASERAKRPQRRRVLHVDYCDLPLPAPLEWALEVD